MDESHATLETLMANRYGSLVACAFLLTGDRVQAEDVVQDALIASFGRHQRFTSLEAAEAYVRKAIMSRFIDQRRRAKGLERKERAMAAIASQQVDGPEVVSLALTDLERALQQLPRQERAVVTARYLMQLSTRESAQALGLSEGSVKRYLSDGLKKLNSLLGTDEAMTEPDTARVTAIGGV